MTEQPDFTDADTARRLIEALLFASREPLSPESLAQHLPDGIAVVPLLADLAGLYQGRGIQLVERDGRYTFRTAADLAPHLRIERRPPQRLPRAAAEVLAIIAYHQPVTRAEIETIRGVSTTRGTIDLLLEADLVRPGPRRETPGRPQCWVTTPYFLDSFGLASLRDLPGIDELRAAGLLEKRTVFGELPFAEPGLTLPMPPTGPED